MRMTDPLSDVLDGFQLRIDSVKRFDLAAPWGIRIPPGQGWFHAVRRGHCHVFASGSAEGMSLKTGDLVVLATGCEHELKDSPASSTTVIEEMSPTVWPNGLEERQGEDWASGTSLVSGCFAIDRQMRHPIHAALPPVVHVGRSSNGALGSLNYILDFIERESASGELGSQTIVSRLVRVLFAKAIQEYVSRMPADLGGPLKALLDPEIGPALMLMQRYPERPWTVASLASAVSMSRSVFASRFTSHVGMPPVHYLQECRMRRACDLMRSNGLGLDKIASQTGYESASAFSRAFKRWAGVAPREYRRSRLFQASPVK